MDALVQQIGELAKASQALARKAFLLYSDEVDSIILMKDHDPQRIERCLDGILDFCFDNSMLSLFKKLCRYYFNINPSATVFYVNAYREIWEDKEEE